MHTIIKTEKQYNTALARLDRIFQAKPGTPESDELELLIVLVEKYEIEVMGELPDPDPIEAIKFIMEQSQFTQTDLAKIVESKSRASEILNRKIPMSLTVMRKIHENWGVSFDILAPKYHLETV